MSRWLKAFLPTNTVRSRLCGVTAALRHSIGTPATIHPHGGSKTICHMRPNLFIGAMRCLRVKPARITVAGTSATKWIQIECFVGTGDTSGRVICVSRLSCERQVFDYTSAYERRGVAIEIGQSWLTAMRSLRAAAQGIGSGRRNECSRRSSCQPLSLKSLPGRVGDASNDAPKNWSPMWFSGLAAHHWPTFQFRIGGFYALPIHLRCHA